MKLLFITALLGLSTFLSAQDNAATDKMERIEETLLRTAEDKKASALILQSRMATEAAFSFLINLPGYPDAVSNGTILEFMDDMEKEYKPYKKLAREAREVKEEKEDYIADINSQYREALESLRESE